MADDRLDWRLKIDVKGVDVGAVARGMKDFIHAATKRMPKGEDGISVEAENERGGVLLIKNATKKQASELAEKARAQIASSRGWNIKYDLTVVPRPEEPRHVGRPAEKPGWDYVEKQLEKQRRELEASYRERAMRSDAVIGSLNRKVEGLTADRDRLLREKEEAEKLRREAENQTDHLFRSLTSFTDDPTKAALQVVGKSAAWVRKLESELGDLGGSTEQKSLEEWLDIAQQDIVSWANSILAPTGKAVSSIEELQSLTKVPSWEESEHHRSGYQAYQTAREELAFLDAIEGGHVKVPESVKDLIVRGIERESREHTVSDYEAKRASHAQDSTAGGLADGALRSHEYASRLKQRLEKQKEGDPLPILLILKGSMASGSSEVHLPSGVEDGVLGKYLSTIVNECALEVGLVVSAPSREQGHLVFVLNQERTDSDRADLLRRQGEFGEKLAARLQESRLKDTGVGFRVIDIRDFSL